MSTYQPPGGQPTEGPPAYPQPQDPWAGEHGLASVPTDPIPQQYGPHTPGDVWSQQTVAHGGQYNYVQPDKPKSRAGLAIGIFLAILLLGGGGGYAAWYVIKHRSPNPGGTASQTTPPVTDVPKTVFNPNAVAQGQCIANHGTNDAPDIEIVECSTQGSYKVVKIVTGADLPEGEDGKLGASTSTAVCQGVKFDRWYAYDDADNTKDVFFCLTNNS
jgi:hypothetical protein